MPLRTALIMAGVTYATMMSVKLGVGIYVSLHPLAPPYDNCGGVYRSTWCPRESNLNAAHDLPRP